jgi:hypothetical protein
MNRYVLNNSDIKSEIITYELSDIEPAYNHDTQNGYFEYYFNNPHKLSNGEGINISNDYETLETNIPIYLRKQVIIGVTEAEKDPVTGDSDETTRVWFWADPNADKIEWETITFDNNGVGILNKYEDYIISTYKFSDFKIKKEITNGDILVAEYHSNTLQVMGNQKYMIACGNFSGMTITHSIIIDDTYLRFRNLELSTDIPIVERGFIYKEKYIFRTNYGYDYTINEWYDEIMPDDECHGFCLSAIVDYQEENFTYRGKKTSGSGYNSPPSVSFSGGGGSGARAHTEISNGVVSNIIIDNPGSGYTDTPTVTIGTGYANAMIADGKIIDINDYEVDIFTPNITKVTNKDGVYSLIPNEVGDRPSTITACDFLINVLPRCEGELQTDFYIEKGNGAEASISKVDSDTGEILEITIQGGGSNYIYPIAYLYTANGFGGYITFETEGGVIKSANIENGGVGYATTDTIEIVDIDYENIFSFVIYYHGKCLRLWREVSSFRIDMALKQNVTLNLMRTDLINTSFVDVETEKIINKIYDNERIRFEPYYYKDGKFQPVYNILYSLSFIKGNTWVDSTLADLAFGDKDVKRLSNRLKNTFIRLSYYNDTNPTNYLLEYYNSVYFNYDLMNSLYNIQASSVSGILGGNTVEQLKTEFNVYLPFLTRIEIGVQKKFIVNNLMCNEGMYIYLYGNEYKKCKPTPLYIKVEFNNALNGIRTLFFNRKATNGADMDNIFLDKTGSNSYVWTKIWVQYVDVSPDQSGDMRYVWYPDTAYLTNITTKPFTVNGSTGVTPITMTLKYYEAKVK